MLSIRRPLVATDVAEGAGELAETHGSAALADALAVIDRGLTDMRYRQIVSSEEVSDLLLDLRVILLLAELDAIGCEPAGTV